MKLQGNHSDTHADTQGNFQILQILGTFKFLSQKGSRFLFQLQKSLSSSFGAVYRKACATNSLCPITLKLKREQHMTHMVTYKKLQKAATYREAAILLSKRCQF